MSQSVTVITPPVKGAIDRGDLGDHMRGSTGALDIASHYGVIIGSATAFYERHTNTSLITRTLRLALDAFPDTIYLPRGPVQSVTSVKYLDADGQQQTLDPSLYHLDAAHQPARLTPAHDTTWPEARNLHGSVTVDYLAGYGDEVPSIPDDVRAALLMLATHFSDNQGATSTLTIKEVPLAVGSVIANRKMPEVV